MTQELQTRLGSWQRASTPLPVAVVPAEGARDGGETEVQWRDRIHENVLDRLDLEQLHRLPDEEARRQISMLAQHLMSEESAPLPAAGRQRIARQVEDEILGHGPIEPLLADANVADILVNGAGSVYVERHGKLELTAHRFRDEAHLRSIIDRIVARVGRRIDEASPMVDARLPDGSRVNAVIPPLALDGSMLSIRRFTLQRLTMERLVEIGTLDAPMAEVLACMVQARLNILISGGTGSGKTTLLNVLSSLISANERILTIEDSAELRLQQPHVGRLETRPPNIEGRGQVTQRDLVRNALRMRPDRIVVGEVRGGEAFDMLQAMNTGHDGSLTTVHANTTRDALSRLENMIAMSGFDLPASTTRAQIASAIQVVVHVERMEDGRRRVVSVQEIDGLEGSVITMGEIFRFRRRGLDAEGRVLGEFEATGVVPRFVQRARQRGIACNPAWFEPRGAR